MTSADGKVTLVVPQNAVNGDTQFTIDPANGFPPSSRIVGTVYDIEPTGTSFPIGARPQLTITYGTLPVGVAPATLTLGTLQNGLWTNVPGSAGNLTDRTVTAPLEHLSPYAVLQPGEEPNQNPIASAGGPYLAQVSQVITFTAVGTVDPDDVLLTYTWNFGDNPGSVSVTTLTTTHAYASPGDFTVTLTVSDGRGGSDSKQTTAEITDLPPPNTPPIADAGGPYVGIVGQSIPFSAADSSDLEGHSLTYVWDFGNGGTANGMTPMYAYTSDQTWPVKVTVSDSAGASDEDVTTATISPIPTTNHPPVITSTTIPTTGLTNQVLAFNAVATDVDGNALTYTWSFGDQTSTPADPFTSATHAYSAAGTFTVALTVNDGHGGQASASGTVTITTPALPVAFSQTYPIYLRQSTDFGYTWLYAMTLSGSGVPPLRFHIVSFPTHRENNPLAPMDLLIGSYYQWWDPVGAGWRPECRTPPVRDQSCRAATSSHVDLTTLEVIVSPGSPATVVYAPQKCAVWAGNPRTDEFTFTVTDKNGLTSAPATISITVYPGVCKDGTH